MDCCFCGRALPTDADRYGDRQAPCCYHCFLAVVETGQADRPGNRFVMSTIAPDDWHARHAEVLDYAAALATKAALARPSRTAALIGGEAGR